jgi:hypothetical protein
MSTLHRRAAILVLLILLALPGTGHAAPTTCTTPGIRVPYTCVRICKMCVKRVGFRVTAKFCNCYISGCFGR